jgi:hypothetical protein
MSDTESPKLCAVCGKPAVHFTVQAYEHRDSLGEFSHGPRDEFGKRYYCKEHVPHIHGEPLEDRLG